MGQNVVTELFENMWNDYLKLNPEADQIFKLFQTREKEVINDHIALRTFNHPKVGVDAISKVFTNNGYTEKNTYKFEQKKLFAKHFEHEDPKMPKVFISELLIEEFSENTQKIINDIVDQIDANRVEQLDFLYSGKSWNISYKTYQELLKESEYAAWMAAFGYRPNHFTVSVNHLSSFKDLVEVNEFLKAKDFKLNPSGGEIKGSKEDLLEQSSTLANKVEVKFTDQTQVIPSCYYEFALRHPMEDGKLYSGFVAKSADKIFESTDTKLQ